MEKKFGANVTALMLANNFIKRALREKFPLYQMKLQKMLYVQYADFYWKSWKENQKLLDNKKEDND